MKPLRAVVPNAVAVGATVVKPTEGVAVLKLENELKAETKAAGVVAPEMVLV